MTGLGFVFFSLSLSLFFLNKFIFIKKDSYVTATDLDV